MGGAIVTPYDEGRAAFTACRTQEANPYTRWWDNWLAWYRGYFDARREDREMVKVVAKQRELLSGPKRVGWDGE